MPHHCQENPQLAVWVDTQRQLYRKRLLNLEKMQKLNAIGFSWDRHKDKWEKYYHNLITYKDQHGHCDVPHYWRENPQLGTWVFYQRKQYHRHLPSTEKIQKLNAIGFSWDVITIFKDKWDRHYRNLIAYRDQHGHCNVPKNGQNPQLACWVAVQRTRYGKGLLSGERIQKLNDIHFSWGLHKDQWEKHYSTLILHKNQHGHCDAPYNYLEYPQLAVWVTGQRQLYRQHLLSAERREKLDALGFDWHPPRNNKKPDESRWEKHYSALMSYKDQQGHCNVPYRWQENPQLAGWVIRQRQLYRKRLLSAERTQKLSDIHFLWALRTLRQKKITP